MNSSAAEESPLRNARISCHYYARDKSPGDRWIARLNEWFMDQAGLPRFIPWLVNSESFPCRTDRFFLRESATRRGSCTSRQRIHGMAPGIFPRNIYGKRALKYDPLYSLSVHTFSLYVYKGSLPQHNVWRWHGMFLKNNVHLNSNVA